MLRIDPFPLVWACIQDWRLPGSTSTSVLRASGRRAFALTEVAETDRFSFDKAERATIELLRQKPWRLHELTLEAAIAPSLVQLLAYCLIVTKQVDVSAGLSFRGSPLPEKEPPSSPFATGEIRTVVAPSPIRCRRRSDEPSVHP